ncbi:MAG: FIST N-terminal domain-containing protein [Thermomicrobiales bacterium]
MIDRVPAGRAALVAGSDWRLVLSQAFAETAEVEPDVTMLFASSAFAADFPDLLAAARQHSGAPILIGCSGAGIIGPEREVEDQPAIAVLQLALPGAKLQTVRFDQAMLDEMSARDQASVPLGEEPGDFGEGSRAPIGAPFGVERDDVNGWLVFADPFRINCEYLVAKLSDAYPGTPIIGGLASADPYERRSWVFFNDQLVADGGIGLAIGGPYAIAPLVSQGCQPIGEPWMITTTQDNWVQTISNRAAAHVMADTLNALPPENQQRAQRNLLVGLAVDEYLHEFARGDFLIRNMVGYDGETGGLALSAFPQPGQTIQFQMRDAATADLDLSMLLDRLRDQIYGRGAVAAVLCTCNGRGIGLFGTPNHDASAIAKKLGPLPLAGLFCNGEIGPVGRRTFVHGFTASLAVIVQTEPL